MSDDTALLTDEQLAWHLFWQGYTEVEYLAGIASTTASPNVETTRKTAIDNLRHFRDAVVRLSGGTSDQGIVGSELPDA